VGALEVAREALADFEADGNDHDSREVAAWLADAEREYARDVKARRAP
jgi:hypothetical protein